MLTSAGHRNLDDVRLVFSELVSNAAVHSRSGRHGGLVALEVAEISDRLLRIAVTDAGSRTFPHSRRPNSEDDHGRGLLVEAVSVRWGGRRGSIGSTVWAEVLTLEDSPSAAAPESSVAMLEARQADWAGTPHSVCHCPTALNSHYLDAHWART
ncbi:ATP-binding protein [Nonomuraea zeae]|uniref:ATP-binding protein n=1 Tax=Nonomuraea zeae TaxID=1642303 RepID=UPI003B848C73